MSFYTSLSGLQSAQTELSVISHNLANVGTNGFKRSRTEFADVIASSLDRSPTQMIGSGTVVKATRQQFGQGNLVQSQSSLDMAISGRGFFAVKPDVDGSKINFTPNGAFWSTPTAMSSMARLAPAGIPGRRVGHGRRDRDRFDDPACACPKSAARRRRPARSR